MQKITIKKFNQITLAEIEITDFLCLIGEQASGKSTIAKLIYLFKSLKVDFLQLFFEETNLSDPEFKKKFIDVIKDKFSENFGGVNLLDNDFEIKYYISVENSHYIKLSKNAINSSLHINFSKKYWYLFTKQAGVLRKQLKQGANPQYSSYLLQTRTRQELIRKIKKFADELFFDTRETLFFPSGRSLITALSNKLPSLFEEDLIYNGVNNSSLSNNSVKRRTIDFSIIREYLDYIRRNESYFVDIRIEDIVSPIINHHIEKILKGNYRNENGRQRIYFDNSQFIPLNIASSGQQDSISILLDAVAIVMENLNATRIIEEPETHLFPNSQKLLVELLVIMCNTARCSYVITTHSPFVIAALNNLLYLHKAINEKPEREEEFLRMFIKDPITCEEAKVLMLDKSKFRAYNLGVSDGDYCKSMIDQETGLIGSNLLDQSAEMIYGVFDKIYDAL